MLKSPALSLRHTTLKKSFDLDEKFFDAVNLETSCKKNKTFQYILTSFSTLFNIKQPLMLADPVLNETYLQSPDSAEDDIDIKSKNEKIKFTKLMSHSK